MKKVSIVSLGCAKNLVHSENMMGILQKHGYELCDDYSEAEAIIINTCGFINSAKEESINTILEMANYKEDKCQVLIVMGCMVQKYPEELAEGLPEVDVFLGTGSYLDIADILDNYTKEQGQMVEIADTWEKESDEAQPRVITTPKSYAYLRISEGCDNNCTYCVIPQMTGPYRSRSIESIVTEAQDLAAQGISEIILVAQDTTYYGYDLSGRFLLVDLLKELNKIDGLRWIRILYAYPNNFDDELIETIASLHKVCKYLDIPLQHGTDKILRKMNRKITVQEIESLIAKLRAKMPDITLRSTFITGFPSETEEDFAELLAFLEKVQLERVGAFAYSREEGTAAALMPEQIPSQTAERRAELLMEEQYDIMYHCHEKRLGQKCLVKVDELSEDIDGLLLCRSMSEAPDVDPYILVYNDFTHQIGDYFWVKITALDEYDMIGEIVNDDELAE